MNRSLMKVRINEIGFFLVPGFSLIAFSSAVEPLRLANQAANSQLYRWYCYSVDGLSVEASNGIRINVSGSYADIDIIPIVIVCGGTDIKNQSNPKLAANLRYLSSHGTALGAVCTGSHILAQAGLLDGYKCTIHWEFVEGFVEDFPDIEVSEDLFVIDRNRFCCAGGTAALDMMLYIIALHKSRDIAIDVSNMMIHHRIRDGNESQRMALRVRFGICHTMLLRAIAHMENNLHEHVSRDELANIANLSTRQLERLFKKYLQNTPIRYHRELRLKKGRDLLLQTSMSIIEVALACGFESASNFSKRYSEFFKVPPNKCRKMEDGVEYSWRRTDDTDKVRNDIISSFR